MRSGADFLTFIEGEDLKTEMDSAKLNSHLDVPAETLPILAEISQEINASLDLDEVLPAAAAQIKRLIDYEVFAVLLPEEGTDQLYFRFAIGHPRRGRRQDRFAIAAPGGVWVGVQPLRISWRKKSQKSYDCCESRVVPRHVNQ